MREPVGLVWSEQLIVEMAFASGLNVDFGESRQWQGMRDQPLFNGRFREKLIAFESRRLSACALHQSSLRDLCLRLGYVFLPAVLPCRLTAWVERSALPISSE